MTLYWLNRQLQMMWQQQVLSKFLYISGPAQPLESHRFSGARRRDYRRGTCDHHDRRQLWSFQVTLGQVCHRCTAYTHRPQATCDRWSVRCLRSCSCAGADEFATGRKRVENRTFCWKCFKHCYFIRWLQLFLVQPARQTKTTSPRDWPQEISCRGAQLGLSHWTTSKTTPQTQLLITHSHGSARVL